MDFGCSGFGRYQAVETRKRNTRKLSNKVAVGLAAIRPLKLQELESPSIPLVVAVGLAAIRPLKRYLDARTVPVPNGCSGFGRYQAVETRRCPVGGLPRIRCSGFGRYQAVETLVSHTKKNFARIVAVGLAAIRPLKQFRFRRTRTRCFRVAVGLAAIRPLKLIADIWINSATACCSEFGRYQAVETRFQLDISRWYRCCSGFGRYQAVETRPRFPSSRTSPVAVGLAAIRPLKLARKVPLAVFRTLQWVWPLSGR